VLAKYQVERFRLVRLFAGPSLYRAARISHGPDTFHLMLAAPLKNRSLHGKVGTVFPPGRIGKKGDFV